METTVFTTDETIKLLVSLVLVFGFVFVNATVMTYLERKLAARFQGRLGPMEIGFQGILQVPVDGIKLLAKQLLVPSDASGFLFRLAPLIAFVPVSLPLLIIPFGPKLQVLDLDVGLLFILSMAAFNTVAVFVAGWSSNNKYAMFGALRSVAQNISYEIPILLSLLAVALMTNSFSMQKIVSAQQSCWFVLVQPVAFLIYFISGLAETNRAPFDLPEAESELTAGYHTEYSGMGFSMFFIAEYTNMFIVCSIATVLFFGGWRGISLPFGDYSHVLWFLGKVYFLMFVMIWCRWTFPRVRFDQLMNLAWKYLIPFSLLNLLITAAVVSL